MKRQSNCDIWFLPGPMEEEPDYLPPGPRAEPCEAEVLEDWRKAEAGHAARLARVAGRLGAFDDRLRRGPEGWRHRLALIEAADLSWFAGDRIGPDRLALWISMRLSGVQDDTAALARVGWAVRRLTGGLGPEVDLSAFLDRRDPENLGGPDNLEAIYPDYVTMCEGFGVKARRVTKREELRDGIREMLDTDEPFLLEVIIPYTEHVLPMIPQGKSAKEMLIE